MKKPTRSAIILISIGILQGAAAYAQTIDDVRNTGSFLVKLRQGDTEQTRTAVQDGWEFTPLETRDDTRGETSAEGWWKLTPRSDDMQTRTVQTESGESINPWDAAYDQYEAEADSTRRSGEAPATALTTRGVDKQQIEFIEPDFAYRLVAATGLSPSPSATPPIPGRSPAPAGGPPPTPRRAPSQTPSPSNIATVGSPQTQDWPTFHEPGEFQGGKFSQLKSARELVEGKLRSAKAPLVRVAFLDTGYDPFHVACPRNILVDLARNFVEDDGNPDGAKLRDQPGPEGSQHHGTGTIGIFGGNAIKLLDTHGKVQFDGVLGAAPMVEIIPMRVATSVVHLENPAFETRPSGTTRAIYYAIKNNCDVISMSHGGLPSKALAEAINSAYENGIAMFFASGDYLRKDHLPIQSPRFVVFPAAFSRTICVCGVTAGLTTYGLPPKGKSPTLRGNWGPKVWMKNAIAAFSPNILWAKISTGPAHEGKNVIDLDGGGTSSATPQAAGAAALWLQYYRNDSVLAPKWRTWWKAQAVYQALLSTAIQSNQYSNINDSKEYFGNGILQAKPALDRKPPSSLSPQKQDEAKVGLGWIRLLFSILPSVRGNELASNHVFSEMLNLEIAQLAARSIKLQEIIQETGDLIPDDSTSSSPAPKLADFRKRFFSSLRDDPRCSNRLRSIINEAL